MTRTNAPDDWTRTSLMDAEIGDDSVDADEPDDVDECT